MPTIKISGDEMDEYIYGNSVLDELVETTRWAILHRVIFQRNGKLYETHYREPATECQEEPMEDYYDCTEVEAYEKKSVDYRAVE